MTTDDQIKDEKLQYGINREAAKILLRHEEIFSSNQKTNNRTSYM